MGEVTFFGSIIVGGLIVLVLAIGTPIYALNYKVQKSACRAFERESKYDTKFEALVKLGPLPVSWDCFALTTTGKWVPKSRLREDD